MTYRELAAWIAALTPDQQDCDVTVLRCDENEFMPLKGTGINAESDDDPDCFDVIDPSHPYLMID
jgi:hypothetical protein